MTMSFRTFRTVVLLLLIGFLLPISLASDDFQGIQELPDYPVYPTGQPAPGTFYPMPGQPNYPTPYTTMYAPYPPPAPTQAPLAQEPPKPWYKKLLSPVSKKANLPIKQVQPVPKDKPKETLALKDPIIRLAKGIRYNHQSLPPGIYLLRLIESNNDTEASLVIQRQQHPMLTVPIGSRTGNTMEKADPKAQSLPPAPDITSKASEKGKAQHSTSIQETKTPPEAEGWVELSEDGQSVKLVYKAPKIVYTSVPLLVDGPWQP